MSLRTSNLSLLLVSLQSCRGSLCGGAHSDGAAASEIRKSTVWNANISSWNQHHEYWLHEAQKAHIPVLCFQETQISNISAPSAIAAARSAGYHMWLVPCPAHRKGGTAILVQQHLPVTCHQEVSNGGGQFLAVEVSGLQGSVVNIASVYSYCKETSLFPTIETWCHTISRRPALLMGDFNDIAHSQIMLPTLSKYGFASCAQGGHSRSSSPIDYIFHKNLYIQNGGVHASVTAKDHDLLFACLPSVFPCQIPTSFKVSPCAPRNLDIKIQSQQVVFNEPQWRQLLTDYKVSEAWEMWSKTVEAMLLETNSYRPRGSVPQVKQAEERRGQGQSHLEREIRRVIRRCHEAHTQSHRRGVAHVDPSLHKQILKDVHRLGGDVQLVHNRLWGPLNKWLNDLLDSQRNVQQKFALNQWRAKMQNLTCATAWLKAKAPHPIVLTANDRSISGPAAVVEELHAWWSNLWLTTSQRKETMLCASLHEVWMRSGRMTHAQPLEPLSVRALRNALKRMKGKATGLDGWDVDLILSLPDSCLQKLVELLTTIEVAAEWPPALLSWKIRFLPKKDRQLLASQYRPIAVGSIVYRAWAAARASPFAEHFSS